MLLPRIIFKADLVIDQLKQQVYNLSFKCIVYSRGPRRPIELPQTLFLSHIFLYSFLFSSRCQLKMDDALGSLSTLSGPQLDQLVFASFLIYKLSTLQLLVRKAQK